MICLIYLNTLQKTKLKTQKKQLEILVDEKNTLLKETHHHVKNSFQIVSSLLYLQSESIQNKEVAIAETIKTYLEKEGYQICGMSDNVKEAVFDEEALQPDLILVDITLDGT